jgi:hypothetical protein
VLQGFNGSHTQQACFLFTPEPAAPEVRNSNQAQSICLERAHCYSLKQLLTCDERRP